MMLEPSEFQPGAASHEDVFLARYGKLRAWALRLTEGDAGRAEDLVHDAFVQFTFTRPDLARVENLDGYLHRMLRNLNVSRVRREQKRREDPLAVVEYDSAEFALRATDPRDLIRVQDDLRQVCRYACLRKETSKAGSVLILRFMHGYYPAEIARLLSCSREAVEERLRAARTEARQFLKDPASLRFIARKPAGSNASAATGFAQTADELLLDLRRRVFDSCRGECPTGGALADMYRGADSTPPDCATLAHLVSCPDCIDRLNLLHDLPPLSSRYPTDALGSDGRRRKSGGGGGDDEDGFGGGKGGGGADSAGPATREEVGRCRRRAREVFEHRPRELCVAVNGRLLAAQKVGAAFNEQKLNVGAREDVDFIEVFSEQDVRLLCLDPRAWPAGDDAARTIQVSLSDSRTLEARLTYFESAATLQVVYHDPLMAVGAEPAHESAAEPIRVVSEGGRRVGRESRVGVFAPLAEALRRLRKILGRMLNPAVLLRPGAVAAALSLLVVAALLFTKFYDPAVSAAELLRRAADAEEAAVNAGGNAVIQRTVFVEEVKARGVSRRRVETWQGAGVGAKVRRLYDERGGLVAGERTEADGSSAVYRPGTTPAEGVAPTARELLDAGEVWRIDPSAKSFNALGTEAAALKVEEKPGAYVVSYEPAAVAEGLVSAALWLNKADLHGFRLTLVVRRGGETVEHRLIEGGVRRWRAEEAPPAVFQLEPELLEAARGEGGAAGAARAQRGETTPPSSSHGARAPAVASAELEVEVAYLLNHIKANLGEQVSLGRTTGGALRVEALVESEARKEAILRALGPVIENPAVVVDVSTVEEALARRGEGAAGRPSLNEREVDVRVGRIPADEELRAHFSARLADGVRVEAEIKRYAARAMGHSRQALLHASALKRLAGRFTPAEARALGTEARAKWLAMVREHAAAYRREVSALRSHLSTVFGASSEGAQAETLSEANLAAAAERLLRLSYAQDGWVRSAFTISEEGGTAAAVRSAQFRRTLAASERLAAAIQEAYER